VVYRDFPEETVVLNLETGQYHGLNATARRMLEALDDAGDVELAVAQLAAELDVPRSRIEAGLSKLCAGLAARGLLELHDDQAA